MTDVELTRALERGEVANHDFRMRRICMSRGSI